MTDLEIAYPEIVTLIEAYERALFKKMEKDPSDSDVRTAYMANLINMESDPALFAPSFFPSVNI